MQQGKLTIRTDRRIRQLRCAVPIDAIAPQSAEAHVEVLGRRDVEAAANAAADSRIVVSPCSGRDGGGGSIRKHAITEEAPDAEELIMAEARLFIDDLGNQVGSKVVRIGCNRGRRSRARLTCTVIKTAIGSGSAHQVIVGASKCCTGISGACRRAAWSKGLRVFHREAGPEPILEVLDEACAVLTLPNEAHVICRIDGLRQQLRAIDDASPILRGKAPLLTGSKDPAVLRFGLSPKLTLTQHIAVALVVVRGNAGAQPVHLVVAAQSPVVQLAFSHQCKTRLATCTVKLTHRRVVGTFKRNGVEGGIDVRRCRAIPVHSRSFNKAAIWRKRNALVV